MLRSVSWKVFPLCGVLTWWGTMKISQVDGLISFLKFYLGKSTLDVLYFNVDLMSNFLKLN
jgi:hypothetical protein